MRKRRQKHRVADTSCLHEEACTHRKMWSTGKCVDINLRGGWNLNIKERSIYTGQEQESNIISHEFSVSHTQMKTVLTFRHTHQEQWMYEGLMPQRFDDYDSKEKKVFHCEKLLYVIGWTQVSMSAEMHKYTEISLHCIWTDICADTHKPCCKKLARAKVAAKCGLTSPLQRFSNQGWDVDVAHSSLRERQKLDVFVTFMWHYWCFWSLRTWQNATFLTSERSPLRTWILAMLSSQVRRSSGVLA